MTQLHTDTDYRGDMYTLIFGHMSVSQKIAQREISGSPEGTNGFYMRWKIIGRSLYARTRAASLSSLDPSASITSKKGTLVP